MKRKRLIRIIKFSRIMHGLHSQVLAFFTTLANLDFAFIFSGLSIFFVMLVLYYPQNVTLLSVLALLASLLSIIVPRIINVKDFNDMAFVRSKLYNEYNTLYFKYIDDNISSEEALKQYRSLVELEIKMWKEYAENRYPIITAKSSAGKAIKTSIMVKAPYVFIKTVDLDKKIVTAKLNGNKNTVPTIFKISSKRVYIIKRTDKAGN